MKKIVIDIYGADAGPQVVLKGAAKALEQYDIFPIFVGDSELINGQMRSLGVSDDRYEIIHTTDFISNNEPPHSIFGGRNESSIALGYQRLKEDDECIAFLSAGNTGALLVGSICRLGLLPSIKFPSLCSALPCGNENFGV